jgi:hypothetical protein
MTPIARSILVIALALPVPAIGQAQSASTDPPASARPTGHLYIANTTSQDMVLYVESEGLQRTEHRLGPGMAGTFPGEAGDTWFNIELVPATHTDMPSGNSAAQQPAPR